MAVAHRDGFSTAVRIYLEIKGQVYRVAQVGGNSLVLRDPCDIQPKTTAHVIITVDGDRHVYPVILRELLPQNVVVFDYDNACRLADYERIAAAT